MKRALALKISGRVQGVGFRYGVKKLADNFGLVGQVRNCPDGTVEITAEGEEGDLKRLSAECYNGTKLARVDKIDEKWSDAVGRFDKFSIV